MLMLLITVLFGLCQSASVENVKWWEPEQYKCDGVVYYKAPFVYYYSPAAGDICVFGRKGCVPSAKKLYDTYKECHKANFGEYKRKTISFMCQDSYFDRQPYVEKINNAQVVLFSDVACGLREKLCPEGYRCQQLDGKTFYGCCSETQMVSDQYRGGYPTRTQFSYAMFD